MTKSKPTTSPYILITNGSGMNNKLCYGYHISTNKTKIAEVCGILLEFWTVFQTEVMAISVASSKIKELNITNKNILYILSDGSSAINTVNKCVINRITLVECLNITSELTSNNSISLRWVSAHCIVPGNEVVDALVKSGIERKIYIKVYIPKWVCVVASRSLPAQRVPGSIPAFCKSSSHQAVNWYSFGWRHTLPSS